MPFTPVKEEAMKYDIPVYQPLKVRDPECRGEFWKTLLRTSLLWQHLDRSFRKKILDMPKYGCINIHASLLPKYRGAAPIQQAVIDGEEGIRSHDHAEWERGTGYR